MHQGPISATAQPAYKAGAAALMLALAAIVSAFAFEYIGGYAPCPLCLMQRYAYFVGIPLLFVGLVLVATEYDRWASIAFAVVAIAFLANAGLGVYHVGAEWKFWPGPDTCSAASQTLGAGAGGLLKDLETTRVIRCDEAPWQMFGLSFAGWNVVISLLIAIAALQAAFAGSARHTQRRMSEL